MLTTVFLLGVAWALLTPAFQAPDENSHFGYVQSLAGVGQLPGEPGRPQFSTEQQLAASASGADRIAARTAVRPEWDPLGYERWRRQDARLSDTQRRDGGGSNPASSNPPLYYLYETIAYEGASAGDVFDRLLAARIASLLWLLVTTAGAWLLAGEVFGRNRPLQLTTAAIAGLMPMVTFVSSSVTPDALLYALWTLALWLGVLLIKRGLTPAPVAALAAVVGLTIAVKATGYALLPAAALVLAIGLARLRPDARRATVLVGAALAALALTLGGWLVIAGELARPATAQVTAVASADTDWRELLSYLWQFYLPRTPLQEDVRVVPFDNPAFHVFLKGGWAAFGWLEVQFPAPVYAGIAAITAAVAVAAGVVLWRTRATIDRGVAAFFLLTCAALVGGLHWAEYHQYKTMQGSFIQGRYLFPLIALAGLAVAHALTLVPASRRLTGVSAVLAALVVLQVLSLGLVAARFYA